jgi:hypothetical protein
VPYGNATASGYAPETWYHVAATVDREEGETFLFVDGVPVDYSSWDTTTNPLPYEGAWYLGTSLPTGADYRYPADGMIDDVRIYERVLSFDEIISLHALR